MFGGDDAHQLVLVSAFGVWLLLALVHLCAATPIAHVRRIFSRSTVADCEADAVDDEPSLNNSNVGARKLLVRSAWLSDEEPHNSRCSFPPNWRCHNAIQGEWLCALSIFFFNLLEQSPTSSTLVPFRHQQRRPRSLSSLAVAQWFSAQQTTSTSPHSDCCCSSCSPWRGRLSPSPSLISWSFGV